MSKYRDQGLSWPYMYGFPIILSRGGGVNRETHYLLSCAEVETLYPCTCMYSVCCANLS